jgi:hypothetical protein
MPVPPKEDPRICLLPKGRKKGNYPLLALDTTDLGEAYGTGSRRGMIYLFAQDRQEQAASTAVEDI